MAKIIKCKSCGEIIEKGAKVCPYCGAKKKVSAFPGIAAIILGVIIIVGALGSRGGSSKDNKATDKTTNTPTTEQTQTTESKTPENDVGTPTNENIQIPLDTLMAQIEDITAKNYGKDNYKMEYDDESVTISVWADGVAMGATYAAAGDETCLESWKTLVDATKDNCKSIEGALEAAGYDDMLVMVSVLNDQNLENTLLTVANGAVIYDSVQG